MESHDPYSAAGYLDTGYLFIYLFIYFFIGLLSIYFLIFIFRFFYDPAVRTQHPAPRPAFSEQPEDFNLPIMQSFPDL